jgi:hypothetical protein
MSVACRITRPNGSGGDYDEEAMSDQLREIVEQQWAKVAPPEFMAVVLKLSLANYRIVDKYVTEFGERAMRLRDQAWQEHNQDRVPVPCPHFQPSWCVMDVDRRTVELLKAEATCPECDEAAKHAYSDATTPGFFSAKCAKHSKAEAKHD